MMPRSTLLRTISNAVYLLLFLMFTFQNPIANAASAEREKMLEGAKKEGRLVLYTGMDTDEANQYAREFTKRYPFIKPELFRSSGERVETRCLTAHRASVHNGEILQTSIVQGYSLTRTGP